MSDQNLINERLLGSRVRPVSTALVRTLPDGSSVVLDLSSERYFGLDSVGAEMWEALTTHSTVQDAKRHLMSLYDVEEERLGADITEFVSTLRSRGLIDIIEDH